jgi:DNA-directed RNA polymerase subunit RPC12/RpoP
MDELLRLDGNAAAGVLGEAFSFEVTTAEYACVGCGRSGTLGAAMVYEVREMGMVVRCPGCEYALIRLSQAGERRMMDLRGTKYITV